MRTDLHSCHHPGTKAHFLAAPIFTHLSLLLGLFILFQINLILILIILLVERVVVVIIVRVGPETALATAFKVGKRLGKDIILELLAKLFPNTISALSVIFQKKKKQRTLKKSAFS